MCGRFARRSTQEILADWFGVPLEEMPWFEPTFNAAPQSIQPVLRLNRDSGRREFALLKWGLVPYWAKDPKAGYSTINARSEDVAAKPMFREPLKRRRCLVPADAFYEWRRIDPKTKQPFAFALKSGGPWAFAGLWETWKPKDGAPLETFTILTTDPNAVMEPIHNRMPAILAPGDYSRWLDPGDPTRPPIDLLRPFPDDQMEMWPVSDAVGNTRNDSPALLERMTAPPARTPAAKKFAKADPAQPSLFGNDEPCKWS